MWSIICTWGGVNGFGRNTHAPAATLSSQTFGSCPAVIMPTGMPCNRSSAFIKRIKSSIQMIDSYECQTSNGTRSPSRLDLRIGQGCRRTQSKKTRERGRVTIEKTRVGDRLIPEKICATQAGYVAGQP